MPKEACHRSINAFARSIEYTLYYMVDLYRSLADLARSGTTTTGLAWRAHLCRPFSRLVDAIPRLPTPRIPLIGPSAGGLQRSACGGSTRRQWSLSAAAHSRLYTARCLSRRQRRCVVARRRARLLRLVIARADLRSAVRPYRYPVARLHMSWWHQGRVNRLHGRCSAGSLQCHVRAFLFRVARGVQSAAPDSSARLEGTWAVCGAEQSVRH